MSEERSCENCENFEGSFEWDVYCKQYPGVPTAEVIHLLGGIDRCWKPRPDGEKR